MHTLATRGLAVVTVAAATLLLASCSSGDGDEAASSSTSASAPVSASASDSATPSTSTSPTGAAAAACLAYFDLDLLNSRYAGGAVDDGNMTDKQAKKQMKAKLTELVGQAQSAVADGSGDQKMVTNAERMQHVVKSLAKKDALSDLSKAKQQTFAKSSLRVQKACERAGFPLPDDNVTARTAAGL